MNRAVRALRLVAVLVLAVALLIPTAAAQDQDDDGPIQIRLEIYVVSLVTRDDGTREERFAETTEARPGQTVEYRLFVENVSEQTLPAGIVTVLGPVPSGTEYVPNSATPSSETLLTEYSADSGRTFSEPPVIIGSGENRRVADQTSYDSIRWTVLVDMEPGQEIPLVYRVIVR